MATNAGKTDMINLALMKLQGATDSGTQGIWTDIANSVFIAPETAAGTSKETIRIACLMYPRILKRAIRDIRPKFAKQYADLGKRIKVTLDSSNVMALADWNYLFNLPSDYLELMFQISQANKKLYYEADVVTANSYAHIVTGDDDQSYYCDTNHISVDDSSDGQPLADDGDGNWTLFNADGTMGATWEESKAYKSDETGKLLVAQEYSNADGDSAYIEYLGYTQTTDAANGFADVPSLYDEHFVDAFTTLFASDLAPYQAEATRRPVLRAEYERLLKPQAKGIGRRPDYETPVVSWLEARNLP